MYFMDAYSLAGQHGGLCRLMRMYTAKNTLFLRKNHILQKNQKIFKKIIFLSRKNEKGGEYIIP